MNCPNCGNKVNATDYYCSFCGARVPHEENRPPQWQNQEISQSSLKNDSRINETKSNNKNKRTILLLVLALIIIGGLAYGGYKILRHYNQESLWEECVSKRQINDLRKYIDDYPDGSHYEEAKEMLASLVEEKGTWEQVSASRDEEVLRVFIRNNPNSLHLEEARELLDNVVWENVTRQNTKEAYKRYIEEFPQGKHIAAARSHFDEQLRAELTTSERDNVKNTVQRFLSGLEQWDVSAMLSTCNSNMSNFMGKRNASLSDVREYYDAYRDSYIDSIGFSSLAVDVKKIIGARNRVEYQVNFTTTRKMWRGDTDEEVVALMKGQALVDDSFRFEELLMDKESQ